MGGNALVVEDDADMREVLVELFAHLGWGSRPVGSLAEARVALEGFEPELALVDWSLPDGSGEDVVALLGAHAPSCRIILATGYGRRVTGALEGRVFATLRKPYALAELARVVERIGG